MSLYAQHRIADAEHRHRAMIAPANHDAVLGQTPDLILVHILQSTARLFRPHPEFRTDDFDAVNAHAPASLGARDLAAQSFGQDLVAEADAYKRLLRFVNPPHEVFQRVNPADVVVS